MSWNADGDRSERDEALNSVWEDVGGPVAADAQRPGFGRVMILPASTADLARPWIDYRSSGVIGSLVVPIWHEASAEHPASPKNGLESDQEVDANAP